MLALQKTHDGEGLELRDVPRPPAPGPGEIALKIAATGICGTDLGIQKWNPGYAAMMNPALPVTLGHETVGRVTALGEGVQAFAIGDAVVVNPAIACGECAACVEGDAVGCLDRRPFGMVLDGAFAGAVNVDARYAYHLPDHVPLELGALVEPLSVGLHALNVAGYNPGDRVVVFGPGPIGQGVAVLAKQMGSQVAVVGFRDAVRFDTLRELGIEQLFDASEEGAMDRLKALAGRGFDLAVEAAGVGSVVDQALAVLRPKGVLSLAGMGEPNAAVNIGLVVRNRLEIRGASRIPPAVWPEVIKLLAADPQAFAPLISHRMKLADAQEAFALAKSGQSSKILLIPEE
ncbi:alcohol dehydrogenase catalytic domain-containing protein [Sphingomonas sp. AOB5]|uniref:zinc-dependent alcohol dehydrogenase n=1 Tax=Sphingomonas sp. AOB5 TaxID=3034017 RepID=UPI0023F6193C|nr:alcohol dehydrogenase catalytic domain-containing protein [Sphingomonas sp. AOB5]MDF7776712.1 alcohol dehydrogenase catalytic domain-containing protein [Sphingomonas sp. AOB5]